MPYDKTQQKRIDAGLCKDCGISRGENGTSIFCRACADKISKRASIRKLNKRKEWKENGSCYNCGGVVDRKGIICFSCNKKANASYHKSKISRLNGKEIRSECRQCKSARIGNSKLCETHWVMDIARKSGLLGKEKELIEKLNNQNWKCFFTGKELVAGINASIDHLSPRSTNPEVESDLDNIVWADKRINSMKGNFNYVDFIDICKTIYIKSTINAIYR